MKYRADVDGLRAIAILLVLVYHGGLALFPSGFIGVDVFFVISGFLITTIIHNSLENQRFSFIDFYNRRLWRLQPVFICLIVVTLVATLILFLPDDLIQYSRSARKTSLFISNIFFKNTTTGYFSPDVFQLPLLHTWSLSIEWQCYLLLPLLMYLLHRIFPATMMNWVIYVLTGIFFVLSMQLSTQYPAESYYQFFSRFFEFLIGSCVAISEFRRFSVNKYLLTLVAMIALGCLFFVATRTNIILGYPNYYALTVCVATAALIAIGRFHPENLAIKCLSIRPLVFVGMLSYSLYIWHWVVFSLLRYQSISETTSTLICAYGLTCILGFLSWRFIEKPARRYNQVKFSYTVLLLLVAPILLTHLSSSLIKYNLGLPGRFNQELVTIYNELDKYQKSERPDCIDQELTDTHGHCRVGASNKNSKNALLIGDSFSNHYWNFMDVLGKAANVSVFAQGTSSCLTLPGIYLYDWWHFKDTVYQTCFDETKRYYQMVQNNHYDYVILGQIWINYISDSVINQLGDKRSISLAKERIKAALDNALQRIVASGAKPVLIKSTAVMKQNFHDCFFKHIKFRQKYNPDNCNFDLQATANSQWLDNLFDEMQVKYPQLVIIDPKKVQCRANKCAADINGIPIYRDVGHLTDYASYQLGIRYLEQFKNPLGA